MIPARKKKKELIRRPWEMVEEEELRELEAALETEMMTQEMMIGRGTMTLEMMIETEIAMTIGTEIEAEKVRDQEANHVEGAGRGDETEIDSLIINEMLESAEEQFYIKQLFNIPL